MRAIPKKLLIHDVTAYQEKSTKDWDSKALEEVGSISRVRIEPSSRIVRDKNNAEVQLAAALIIDCRNSDSYTDTFKEDLIIGFQNDLYKVVSVEPLYDERRLHHYELGMVRYAG